MAKAPRSWHEQSPGLKKSQTCRCLGMATGTSPCLKKRQTCRFLADYPYHGHHLHRCLTGLLPENHVHRPFTSCSTLQQSDLRRLHCQVCPSIRAVSVCRHEMWSYAYLLLMRALNLLDEHKSIVLEGQGLVCLQRRVFKGASLKLIR